MGRPYESRIQFDLWSPTRHHITMPKAPCYGQSKNHKAEGVALKVQHGLGLYSTQMRVLHRLCPSLNCGTEGVATDKKGALPLFTGEFPNSRLLVQVCILLLRVATKQDVTMRTDNNPSVGVMFADGVSPRGRTHVHLQVAIIDCSGSLIPRIDTDIRVTPY